MRRKKESSKQGMYMYVALLTIYLCEFCCHNVWLRLDLQVCLASVSTCTTGNTRRETGLSGTTSCDMPTDRPRNPLFSAHHRWPLYNYYNNCYAQFLAAIFFDPLQNNNDKKYYMHHILVIKLRCLVIKTRLCNKI